MPNIANMLFMHFITIIIGLGIILYFKYLFFRYLKLYEMKSTTAKIFHVILNTIIILVSLYVVCEIIALWIYRIGK